MASLESPQNAQEIVRALTLSIDAAVAANGGSTAARRPAHRVKFHWPPQHPVSYSYHVLASDWTGKSSFEAHGETFEVRIARTPHGVFGRCEDLWHEERGDTEEDMLRSLRESCEPLFQRQLAINRALLLPGRFIGHIRDLDPSSLLRLLYCDDRDVANDAKTEIETHASNHVVFPALLAILNDRRHPNRRSAQWCVLDLFEDLPSYCDSEQDEQDAVAAIRGLIWDAEDDFARTIYKAGVVLGGHIPYVYGGPALLECLKAPSPIGRRSAIHGLYHVVEWIPEMKERVVTALREQAQTDPEPILREYAGRMATDIQSGDNDHVADPLFPGER